MEERKWYLKPYVLIAAFLSVTAISMVLLTLMLLPATSEILGVMQWRMVNAQSFRVETDIDYRGLVTKVEDGATAQNRETVTMQTAGYVLRGEDAEARQRHLFQLSVSPKAGDGQTVYKFEGETRLLKGMSFLLLNRIPQKFGSFRLDLFANRWLRIELQEILDQIDVPIIGGGHKLSDEDKLYLIEEFRLAPFLTVVQRLKDGKIGGAKSYHYEVQPEKLFIKDFFVTSETLRRGRELNSEERRTIDRFFTNLKIDHGEVWISHGDYYLRRILLRFRYDDDQREGVLTLTATFSDFNRVTEIDGPGGEVENVSSIIQSLMPSLVNRLPMAQLGGQNAIGDSDRRPGGLPVDGSAIVNFDPDGDGLGNSLEFFYGSDPHNPDSDYDGMNDGDEVQAGRNPNGPGGLFDFGLSRVFGDDEPESEDDMDVGTAATPSED